MQNQQDLLNLMQKMAAFVKDKREKSKEIRIKHVEEPWSGAALVQLTNNYRCRCCGKTFSAPNPWLFIRKNEGQAETHYEKIDEHIAFDQSLWDLPYITEQRDMDVPTCELCFDMTRLFNGHYKKPEQICLPLELH